jgi:hypothetical protein
MSDIFNESIHDLDALIPIYEKKEKEAQAAAKYHVPGTEDGLPRRASLAVQIPWALRQERDRRGQALHKRT